MGARAGIIKGSNLTELTTINGTTHPITHVGQATWTKSEATRTKLEQAGLTFALNETENKKKHSGCVNSWHERKIGQHKLLEASAFISV